MSTEPSYFLANFYQPEVVWQIGGIPARLVMFTYLVLPAALISQGFTLLALWTISVSVAVLVAVATVYGGAVAAAGVIAVAVAVVAASIIPSIGMTTIACGGAVASVMIATAVVGTVFGASIGIDLVAVPSTTFDTRFIAIATLGLSFYVAWQALKGDAKFALVCSIGVVLGALGGTNFYNADLTDADFSSAILKSTNFNAATLTRTCWTNAKHLDRARVGNSILSNAKVRELLVTGNGYKQDYENCDLRGANLTGATLHKANLKRADLGEATLHKADLREANLTEVQAIDTDFTEAALTGACLEGWNIDHTTKLDRVDCQYVFLLEHANAMGNRDRRPHDPDRVFAKGDFAKLYKKMINVVQILLRDGINQEAFREAFQKLMEEHPEISIDSIQGIEKKGNDVLVTLEVAETADKVKIEQDFLKPYEDRLRQLEAENEQLKLRSADLREIALNLTRQSISINQVVGDGKVNEVNQSQNFSVGGDFTVTANNSVIGLRDISGAVTNSIAQIPNAPAGEANLKELLTQLQAVLETADRAVLPDADKADALEQVKLLAEAAQKPEPEKTAVGAKAIRFLQRIIGAVPTALPIAATLVTEFNKLVPAIAKLLGL